MEDNTSAKFEFLASFILPNGILDWFDFVKANEEPVEKKDCIYKSTLHIYLDEKDNRTNEHLLLKPNGFTEPTVIKDFPVRNRNLILHVRRRRYLDENGKNVILNLYPTTAEGTRYMDLSSSMRAIVSTVFPNATIVLDCFHVLKRCHDAIEEVRLHLKRDAQVELRRQEREHRQTQKRRAQSRRRYRKKHPRKPGAIMRGRPPKRKNERFKAPTYSNGDTKLELLTRTKRALTQSREKWSDKTAERMKILFQEEPKLKEAYDIVNGLRSIFRSKTLDKEAAKVKLHDWYETATRCSLREIKSARDAIKSREDEVLNYFINHSTNAGAESLNSKIKTFRSQLRGVSDYTFFMYRIYKIFG